MEQQHKITILYIDDEINNLTAFKAAFRFQYNIINALSAAEALDVLKVNQNIVAILCDQRMPEMTGIEFFEKVRFEYPNPVRILVTGYTDLEDVVNAINRGNIFRYIKKPWSETDIISAIEEANNYYQARMTLIQQNESLKKAYKELDRFAYSVTHDLKGPIVSSIELINIIDTVDDKERDFILSLIKNSLMKLDQFVVNIFDYYKLKQGEVSIEKIDFSDFINDQKQIHATALKLNNITFEVNINQKIDFYSDKIGLQIIFNNLIGNAVKYQKKHVDYKYIWVDINVSKGIAQISVKDNGIGIEEQYLPNIFDIFYRATSEEMGNGIGLYNVKDAVAKLGGDINVRSKHAEGTEFIVNLPSKI
jgi:two-component system sensor histidine kinase/response regulator